MRRTAQNPLSLSLGALLLAAAAAAAEPEPLTLEEALRLAASTNETPAVAAARLERAQALRRQAVSVLVPSFTLTGTYTRRPREITRVIDGDEVTVQAIDGLSGQAVARATLFDLRALPLLRAATRGVDAQRLESAELERALAHDVADGYFLALGTERLRDAARERVRAAAATFAEAQLRVEAGLAGRNDATRTELELATARLEETQADSDVRVSRLALEFLVAAPVLDRPLVEPAAPELLAGERPDLVALALGERADLAALRERAEQARQLARAPRYGVLPRLDAAGVYRATNESGLSGRDEDWNVAVGLTWELFDGGSRAAVAAQRDAETREAELAVARGEREVALEVDVALAELATAEAAVAQAEVRLGVAKANALEVRERFSNGLATALEQTDAAVEQFEAETEVVRQRYSRALARLALGRALGAWPTSAVASAARTATTSPFLREVTPP